MVLFVVAEAAWLIRACWPMCDLVDLEQLVPVGAAMPSMGDVSSLCEESVCEESVRTETVRGPFDDVPASVRGALEGRGFLELTSVQRAVLDAEVEGRDLQISSQTGSGKTVALGFVLAAALEGERGGRGPDVLIIVPTRELATQVGKELEWLYAGLVGVRSESVTGGTPVFKDRQMLSRGPRLLVGTPGRLLDHVRSGVLDLGNVQELVLDEADQMLDMGFREELEGILDETPATRRTHLVSATFPKGIQQLAARYQRDAVSIEGTRLGDANQDIVHEGHLVNVRDRYDALVNLLLMAGEERTLVFVERRADALQVAEKLEADGFAALPLSGELAQSQRERTMEAFRSGRANVLVATDVAARGLDVPDVATVIHTAPCIDAHIYTHRSGRTGRAGKQGRSVQLAPPNKRYRVTRMMDQARVEMSWLPLPKAKEVRRVVNARAHAALKGQLETALAEGPTERFMEQAKELLAEHESQSLVAALLARLAPKQRAEPRDLHSPPLSKGQGQSGQHQGGRHQSGGFGGSRKPQRGGKGRFNSVRFFINCGTNQGATPGRILAALCRRGQVSGSDIGSIAVHPNASTFDVCVDVAVEFEVNAGQRDARDPKTMIRRDRGPVPSGGNGYSKPAGAKSYSKPAAGKSYAKPAAAKTYKKSAPTKKPRSKLGRTKLIARGLRR